MDKPKVVKFQDVSHLWNAGQQAWTRPDLVYIGRENQSYRLPASPWGNPYEIEKIAKQQKISRDAARQVAITMYRPYILINMWKRLPELHGKTLVCWCDPLPCHGHVLSELAVLPDDELANQLEWAYIAGAQTVPSDEQIRLKKKGSSRPTGPEQLTLF